MGSEDRNKVVFPNVAPAHEPGEHRHFSNGVALVALEDGPGRGGEGTGIAALPAEQGVSLAPGDLRCQQMRFWNGQFNSSKPRFNAPSPLPAITESLGSVPVGWCLPLDALLVFLTHPGKIGPMEFAVVTSSERNCHLYRGRLSPFQSKCFAGGNHCGG